LRTPRRRGSPSAVRSDGKAVGAPRARIPSAFIRTEQRDRIAEAGRFPRFGDRAAALVEGRRGASLQIGPRSRGRRPPSGRTFACDVDRKSCGCGARLDHGHHRGTPPARTERPYGGHRRTRRVDLGRPEEPRDCLRRKRKISERTTTVVTPPGGARRLEGDPGNPPEGSERPAAPRYGPTASWGHLMDVSTAITLYHVCQSLHHWMSALNGKSSK